VIKYQANAPATVENSRNAEREKVEKSHQRTETSKSKSKKSQRDSIRGEVEEESPDRETGPEGPETGAESMRSIDIKQQRYDVFKGEAEDGDGLLSPPQTQLLSGGNIKIMSSRGGER
jgi:hypothetical protein